MHRQVVDGFTRLDWNNLPPAKSDGRTRLLVISQEALGGITYNRQVEHYTQQRSDFDVVHIRIKPSFGMRVAGRIAQHQPFGLDSCTPAAYLGRRMRAPLDRLLKRGVFDAVHATRQGVALAAARLRRRYEFCFSTTADSTVPAYHAMTQGKTYAPDAQEGEIFAAADVLSPYSDWVADSAIQDYHVDPANILIVRPAPIPEFRPARSPTDHPHLPRLLFVGNDSNRKGLPRLLRWHQAHWAERAELHVVSAKAKIDSSLKNVIWHGAMPYRKLIAEVWSCADIFVMPTFLDTYGQVYAEALCSGVPAVGTRLAAIPEIIKDGVTGYTCAPHDEAAFVRAIERLLNDAPLRARMRRASLSRAATSFDSDHNYNLFFDRIRDIVEARSHAFAVV